MQHRSRRRVWFALGVLFTLVIQLACKGQSAIPDRDDDPVAEEGTRSSATHTGHGHGHGHGHESHGEARAPAAQKPIVPIPEERGRALVESWLAAQNGGDFPAYAGLYAADMRAVHRADGAVERLDRGAWLDRRQRSFEKPMSVSAERYSFVMRASGLYVYFTERRASGEREEVHRKLLLIGTESAPGDRAGDTARLVIRHEEMLDVAILSPIESARSAIGTRAPPAPGDVQVAGLGMGSNPGERVHLAFVERGAVFLARVSHDIGTGPVEEIHQQVDSRSGYTEAAAARRRIAEASIPPRIARAIGRDVDLYSRDLEFVCQARIGRALTLEAEDWLRTDAYPENALAALWHEATFRVLARLEDAPPGCLEKALFVRDAELGRLPGRAAGLGVPARDRQLLQQELDEMVAHHKEHSGYPMELLRYTAEFHPHPAEDRVLATLAQAVAASCAFRESYASTFYRVTRNPSGFWDFEKLFETAQEESLLFALDVDGDEIVEIVTDRGVFMMGDGSVEKNGYQVWRPDLRVFWPPGVGCDE